MNNPAGILQTYLRRLSRLSGNNRSLRLFRLSADQFIDLSTLQGVEVKEAFEIVAALLGRKGIKICEVSNSRVPFVNKLSGQLRRLARAAAFLFEERGTLDLHLAWPMVRGKLAEGVPVSAPLLFFPVRLEADKKFWRLYLRKDEGIVLNRTLLLAYYHYRQLPADEELLEFTFEDTDPDTTVFRTRLYQLLKDKLDIRFVPDIYSDHLAPFDAFSRQEFDEKFQDIGLKMFHQGVLGIFPQADSQLMPDYLQMIEKGSIQQIEDFFFKQGENPGGSGGALPVTEEKLYVPFPLDSWQEEALKVCKSGRSLVVYGPPGTGKSQLIAAIIADAMATGRKVLVVSQKRVALDVVFERLQGAGLANYAALIHDFRHDLTELYARLARLIDRVDTVSQKADALVESPEAVHFLQFSRTIDKLTDECEEYKKALFDNSECGLSAKELYLTSSPETPHVSLRQEFHHFHFNNLHGFLQKLRQYVAYARQFEQSDYPLRERKSFAGLPLSARAAIEATIKQVREELENMALSMRRLTGRELYYEEIENLWNLKDSLHNLTGLLTDETTFLFFQQMAGEEDDETSLLWLQNMQRVCLNCFNHPGVEATLRDDQMGQCQIALQQRLSARKSIVRLIKWELFSDQKFFLKRVLVANGLNYSREGLYTLEQRLDNRLNLIHHITALRQKKWLRDIPEVYELRTWKKWFEKQELALRAKLLFGSIRELNSIDPDKFTRDEFIRLLWNIIDEVETFWQKKESWQRYLSPYQIAALARSPGLWVSWVQQLRLDFDNLCAFDSLRESLQQHEKSVIDKLHDNLQNHEAAEYERVFLNSLKLAWIDHLETKYPVLRWPSSLHLEHVQQEWQQAVAGKRKAAREVVVQRARQQTVLHVQYNRLQNRITYRDLYHQVTKKKRRWPLRRLMASFADELFQLVPCWMASPETVSAVFPLQELFDLVIFDEASQCFAEYGLPAIYRGKQVVVAGDPKQLRPFDLYQVRWKEEDDNPDLEVESLLELAMRYLPSANLNGHYRSQHPELIAFSNRHFYNNRLDMLPHRSAFAQKQSPFEFIKVEGVWHDQVNEAEADKVVELVLACSQNDPGATLGVVTFNAPQQELIMDKLADVAEAGGKWPEHLFVKNIENIQGDERDIIIFSVGYARDKHGKIKLQFGSLSMPGGENRLNVAVTRARRKVVVVASLWPDELQVQDVKNEGPRLLREYLEYVRRAAASESRLELLQNHGAEDGRPQLALQLQEWLEQHAPGIQTCLRPFPSTDLLVVQNGAAGVVLTDDTCFAALPVKGSWVHLPQLLREKEWPALMLSSRNWWANREQAILQVQKFLHRLAEQVS
ncbi:MAG: hypothetical protein KatS3mg032_1223 [Cyclobacteriaceae bacterium]|nr:MAG: hypothetical protein KatS3mg032_1223 [Cyclobacteriaceae bacterium]